MIFVDTNVFLEAFIRKGRKSDRCRKLIEKGDGLWTTELVVSEIEWVLRDGFDLNRQVIFKTLKHVLGMDTIKIENKNVLIKALNIYAESKADWVDCVNAEKLLSEGMSEAYSYDKHFDKFKGISRFEP